MAQTPVEAYIEALKNYKKLNGSLDDAIILAESLLLALERKHIVDANRDGVDMVIGSDSFITGEDYFIKKYHV